MCLKIKSARPAPQGSFLKTWRITNGSNDRDRRKKWHDHQQFSTSFHDHHQQQQHASSFTNAAHIAATASSASSYDNATSTTEEEENYDDGIDDHHQLQLWAAIERLPTFTRLRTSLVDHKILIDRKREEAVGKTMIDVTKLRALERRVLVEKLVTKIDIE
ncbi:hypothetical protein Ddye_029348 [Dipteronia dyeriana]|uniref:Uncharacterized protein n=1 Tax=Dipteronia dyeriana TaxID=168575 RepID=A0AAD9TEM5_9ROSI|nr:hypothetical protein Ddye_029348 [Dipteronia dyeriana]